MCVFCVVCGVVCVCLGVCVCVCVCVGVGMRASMRGVTAVFLNI